jgi:hypothetical protein
MKKLSKYIRYYLWIHLLLIRRELEFLALHRYNTKSLRWQLMELHIHWIDFLFTFCTFLNSNIKYTNKDYEETI